MRMHKVQERSPGTIFRFHSHFKKTRMYERRDHSDPEEGQSKSVSKSTWTTRQKTVEMLAQKTGGRQKWEDVHGKTQTTASEKAAYQIEGAEDNQRSMMAANVVLKTHYFH
ncbi:hypothetical protein QTP86_012284 [Hemibagrus guttatus]|nr:hypothetical protein QTP86_012284 [Hemibagrus guttatus]